MGDNVATRATSSLSSETEELQRLENAPPFWRNRKRLSKQLSMCEPPRRDLLWERRRRQMHKLEKKKENEVEEITDEDLSELKGCIELGFGFNEEDGQGLCNTLPALDLYFAVNRQFSMSPASSPNRPSSASSTFVSPRSSDADSWKIVSPGNIKNNIYLYISFLNYHFCLNKF